MRYELDVGAERSVTRLRVLAAVVVALAGGALVAGGAGAVGWVIVIAGWLAAFGWAALALRARRRLADAHRHYLDLGDRALVLARGDRIDEVPWAAVRAVHADEDGLCVRVSHRDGELAIPLLWRGAGLHDLAEAVEGAARAHGSPLETGRESPSAA